MRAGPLDKRVVIERPTESASASGEPVPAWNRVRETWAGIQPLRGSEGIHGGGVDTQHQFKITMRYAPSYPLETTDRIVEKYGEKRTFDIQSVSNVQTDDRMLEVMAVQHGA